MILLCECGTATNGYDTLIALAFIALLGYGVYSFFRMVREDDL